MSLSSYQLEDITWKIAEEWPPVDPDMMLHVAYHGSDTDGVALLQAWAIFGLVYSGKMQ